MDAPFPFGFPPATAFYLTLLVSTLVLHFVFMHYVLAGAGYLVVRSLALGNRADRSRSAELLREWLPFMLSAAITAGIGPLLFLQIVYQHRFYTANLLLFYRWLGILPALVVGFYLLYLLKADAAVLRRLPLRALIKVIIFGCFGYIAWLWTTNHLLSVQSLETWTAQYAAGTVLYRTPEFAPRLAMWVCSTFPTLALWLAWQLRWTTCAEMETTELERDALAKEVRTLAVTALAGICLTAVFAGLYYRILPPLAQNAITTRTVARGYLVLMGAGALGQAALWAALLFRPDPTRRMLAALSVALLATLTGFAVVREVVRVAQVEFASLYDAHRAAASVAGWGVFVFFLILNTLLIAFCIRLVQKARPGH